MYDADKPRNYDLFIDTLRIAERPIDRDQLSRRMKLSKSTIEKSIGGWIRRSHGAVVKIPGHLVDGVSMGEHYALEHLSRNLRGAAR